VIGVNTLIISPSGGLDAASALRCPSKTVDGVVRSDQAESSASFAAVDSAFDPAGQPTRSPKKPQHFKPARGAMSAGVADKGPAKAGGHEPGAVSSS